MDWLLWIAYFVLIALALAQSLVLTLQTWEHRRYVRSSMGYLQCRRFARAGHVAVFAPCKGHDVDLEANLSAVMRQEYDDYDVTFIVESEQDPACATIRRVMAAHGAVPSRLLVAGIAEGTGQKVHNLRMATTEIPPQVEFLAFIDSDAAPRPKWLRQLTTQLIEEDEAAVTGYRWFVPVRNSLANHLLYGVNCGVMSLLGHRSHYLIWGGSWGISREVFDRINLRAAWQGTLSDDLMASRTLRDMKLPVRFEPASVVASPLDYSAREMFAFIRRQYLVTRFYMPDWWAFAVAVTGFSKMVWLGNLLALAAGALWGTPPLWLPLCVCAVLYLLGVFRGRLRQGLVRVYFPEKQQSMRAAGRFDIWAAPAVGLLNWLGVLGSLFGRHVDWRGIRYRLYPGGKIREMHRQDQPPPCGGDEDSPRQTLKIKPQQAVPYRKAG